MEGMALTSAREADGPGSDGRNPRRTVLATLGWPARRLALALGEHPVIVGRFLDGRADLPGVEAWLDLISEPLRRWPRPQAATLSCPEPLMTGVEMRAAREAMRWTVMDIGVLSDRTAASVRRMEEGRTRVDDRLARWLREVSGPIRSHPLPDGWTPRHAFVQPAPGRASLPRALPDSPRLRERQARAAAQQEAQRGQAERKRLRREGEERRRLVQEERKRITPQERLRLAAERARRAAELDDGQRTVEEIGLELGISHQAVCRLRKLRGERGQATSGPAT